MTDKPQKKPTRSWSTKTLTRELVRFLKDSELQADSTLSELVAVLKSAIVEEEAGVDLDLWGDSE